MHRAKEASALQCRREPVAGAREGQGSRLKGEDPGSRRPCMQEERRTEMGRTRAFAKPERDLSRGLATVATSSVLEPRAALEGEAAVADTPDSCRGN